MASLNERKGPLGRRLAAHLLRRATFRYDIARIDKFASFSAKEAVDELFSVPPLYLPEGPIAPDSGKPAFSLDGSFNDTSIGRAFHYPIYWFLHESLLDTSIRYRMMWYLHICFACVLLSIDGFLHVSLLQHFALGNLRKLALKITLDPQMLRFLDNRSNQKDRPNENYAREFLELFTIQKGPQIGPGDYTHYTEQDVIEAARLLTGFTLGGDNIDPDTGIRTGQIRSNSHDTGDKTFSAAFNNRTIKGRDTDEGIYEELEEFVQMVFDQRETARAYVRKLYRFFVFDRISEEVERDIIDPLAAELQQGDYEIEAIARKLLMSEHFYDDDDNDSTDEIIGGKMRSPIDLIFHATSFFELTDKVPDPKKLGKESDEHYNEFYKTWVIRNVSKKAKMDPLRPPSVFGYDGYATGPDYSKLWFDGSTIITRLKVAEQIVSGNRQGKNRIVTTTPYQIDVVGFVEKHIQNPSSADELVTEISAYLFPEPLTEDRKEYFKSFLVNELQDNDWKTAWDTFKDTGDAVYVIIALRSFFEAILRAPEYQVF